MRCRLLMLSSVTLAVGLCPAYVLSQNYPYQNPVSSTVQNYATTAAQNYATTAVQGAIQNNVPQAYQQATTAAQTYYQQGAANAVQNYATTAAQNYATTAVQGAIQNNVPTAYQQATAAARNYYQQGANAVQSYQTATGQTPIISYKDGKTGTTTYQNVPMQNTAAPTYQSTTTAPSYQNTYQSTTSAYQTTATPTYQNTTGYQPNYQTQTQQTQTQPQPYYQSYQTTTSQTPTYQSSTYQNSAYPSRNPSNYPYQSMQSTNGGYQQPSYQYQNNTANIYPRRRQGGIYGNIGVGGLAIGGTYHLDSYSNARAEVNGFVTALSDTLYRRKISSQLGGYDEKLKLGDIGLYYDWFSNYTIGDKPARLTGGLVFSNSKYTLHKGAATGTVNFPKVGIYLGVGLGHEISESGLGYHTDLGLTIGSATTKLNDTTGLTAAQADLFSSDLNKTKKKFMFTPSIKLGVDYDFF